MENPLSTFHLPLTTAAHSEFLVFQSIIGAAKISTLPETWVWPYNKGIFRSKFIYTLAHSHIQVDPTLKWIWKSSCTLKIKVFGWLLLMDRLNTRDMMQRRHWNVDDHNCVLCNANVLEDRLHLFFTCNFSLRVWNYLGISWFHG